MDDARKTIVGDNVPDLIHPYHLVIEYESERRVTHLKDPVLWSSILVLHHHFCPHSETIFLLSRVNECMVSTVSSFSPVRVIPELIVRFNGNLPSWAFR